MKSTEPCILARNGGSSSTRFAQLEVDESLPRMFARRIGQIGRSDAVFMAGKAAVIHRLLAGDVFAAPHFPQIERIHGAHYPACGIASKDFVDRPGETRTGLEAITATPISVSRCETNPSWPTAGASSLLSRHGFIHS